MLFNGMDSAALVPGRGAGGPFNVGGEDAKQLVDETRAGRLTFRQIAGCK